MMTPLQAVILSVVEGISEFLPISSTGHLILTGKLLGIPETEFVKSFEIFIQLGAILAVVFLYAKTLLLNKKILTRVFLAFLPTATIGYILYKAIKQYLLGNQWVVVVMLFIGGIVLILIERTHKEKENAIDSLDLLSYKQSILIGLAQSVSVIPGVSRAPATIIGGQFAELSRKAAVEFSFLLAIPTMIAATGLDLLKSNAITFNADAWMFLGIGFIGAFLTALFVIKLFIRYIQKNTFISFGIYRIAIALLYTAIVIR
jgi:undecaprenyl-diphosphatase